MIRIINYNYTRQKLLHDVPPDRELIVVAEQLAQTGQLVMLKRKFGVHMTVVFAEDPIETELEHVTAQSRVTLITDELVESTLVAFRY
jgi:hypothetical protein